MLGSIIATCVIMKCMVWDILIRDGKVYSGISSVFSGARTDYFTFPITYRACVLFLRNANPE